ncbi:ABC transporter substrate-binding protein [Anaeromyxobacter terrae]|uniref:ABC transporter substrate-binding protein n=1 Tax=Anaeromyxobacter terrae TaxID=2925406 RepID=UPI001F5AC74E|nr:ABC transporter substrate-binding protein [Anaeromyxobacter sp. SG22]
MRRRLRQLPALAAAALVAGAAAARADDSPSTAAGVIAGGIREGKVVVYAATDADIIAPLLEDFSALYPRISVEYHDLNTRTMNERFLDEVASNAPVADVLWSPAMDLQMKLANDGYAQAYESPEVARLAPWAVWRNEAFGTTLEPFVFIHDRRRLSEAQAPRSHAELARWLEAQGERVRDRVGTGDPERSAIGYLILTQDSRIDPAFPETLHAYARAGLALHATSSSMIEAVHAGRELLAFNVNGSYALHAARQHPELAVIFPKDYVLATSRIALISRTAPHPNAAKVFLDYILSRRGQEVLASRCALFSIRTDVQGEDTVAALSAKLGARLKPIHVGPSLLVFLDGSKRADFLRRWRGVPPER